MGEGVLVVVGEGGFVAGFSVGVGGVVAVVGGCSVVF